MYNIHIFDKIQLMEWEDKAKNDKAWENCKKNFKDYFLAKNVLEARSQLTMDSRVRRT